MSDLCKFSEDYDDEIPETLEDLEEAEEDADVDLAVNIPDIDPLLFKSAFSPFINSIFPVLFIDNKMRILAANKSCENLFTGFFNLAGNYFIDVFGRSFQMEDIRAIRETLVNGKNGYSWKGIARIKSRTMVTVQTRVYLFPADMDSKNSAVFVVMFDDVTEENKSLLRSVFMSLLEASKLKDNDTGKHIVRVNYYSRRLAEELYRRSAYDRIDMDFIDNIGFLASMHDVGKIG
ncbi:MAG: phosphohydrolase, partial [Treponema sp.]|nr:phosphohydrolase [Treponema sp.]